jgi:hypothetical protein
MGHYTVLHFGPSHVGGRPSIYSVLQHNTVGSITVKKSKIIHPRRYSTLLDATRRYLTLLDATRRYSTLLDATRRYSTLLDDSRR